MDPEFDGQRCAALEEAALRMQQFLNALFVHKGSPFCSL